MNPEQETAYADMVEGKSLFITGGGGVGKSYLIKKFYENNKFGTFMTSTTGISALDIGGQTLYSFLGIGLGQDTLEDLVKKLKKYRKVKIWKSIKTLVIDEISMLCPTLFDKLEAVARILRKNEKPFGGIQLILTGDFCQLPCINGNNFCFEATSWDRCIEKTHYLKKIVRQSDAKFIEILEDVRIGAVTPKVKKTLESRMIEFDVKRDIVPTILYTHNAQVDSINQTRLKRLIDVNKHSEVYKLEKKVDPTYFGTVIIPSNLVENLTLTVGAQVMLTINIDVINGLANGSRGVVTGFTEDTRLPIVKFLSQTQSKTVQYYTNIIEEKGKFCYSYSQVPLKLAWAITVHKSQGMTLDLVETDLSRVFEYGQAYVCLSRIKSLEGLYIKDIDYKRIKCHPKALEYYEKLK